MRRLSIGLAALLALSSAGQIASAAEDAPKPTSKLSGYSLFDYSYVADSADEDAKEVFGATVRRVYLTYDYALKPNYKARFRVETNDGVNFLTAPEKSKVGLLVKDAYMQWDITAEWAEAIKPSLVFGIQGTPAFGHLEEKAWKYRSLEKTHLDLRKIASSRDMGIGAKGKVGDSGIAYQLLVGNDTTNAETNKDKRVYGVVSYKKDGVLGEVYGHLRQRPGDESEFTGKVFGGYDGGDYAAHVSAFSRTKSDIGSVAGDDLSSIGVSAFGRYVVAEDVELVARGDFYDGNTDKENDAKTLLLVALAYRPIPQVAFMPNVRIEMPEDSDTASDIVGRLTVHYKF
jgi:hypothetical protein